MSTRKSGFMSTKKAVEYLDWKVGLHVYKNKIPYGQNSKYCNMLTILMNFSIAKGDANPLNLISD